MFMLKLNELIYFVLLKNKMWLLGKEWKSCFKRSKEGNPTLGHEKYFVKQGVDLWTWLVDCWNYCFTIARQIPRKYHNVRYGKSLIFSNGEENIRNTFDKIKPPIKVLLQRALFFLSDLRTSTTLWAINESSPEVGSSQNSKGGFVNTSHAKAKRFISPPDMPFTTPENHFQSANIGLEFLLKKPWPRYPF